MAIKDLSYEIKKDLREQYLTTAQVALQTQIPELYWKRLRHQGEGPPHIYFHKKAVRYRWGDVEAWIDSQKTRPIEDGFNTSSQLNFIHETHLKVIGQAQLIIPVKLSIITNELKVSLYSASLESLLIGAVFKEDEISETGFGIYVNKDHLVSRQRYSLAVAIGHFMRNRYLVEKGFCINVIQDRFCANSYVNQLAMSLARDILCPLHVIESYLKEGVISHKEIAKRLEVHPDLISVALGYPCPTG